MGLLSGVRVVDFTVHAAGPFCTHLLSLMGAECIKVESRMRPDIFRRPHPVYGRMEPSDFDQTSANKRSVTLNLKDPEGATLARQLVARSQMAAESFRPGVMARLGLDYEQLRRVRPDLVMVSISSSGQTGPDARDPGYAPLFGAWGGLGYLTGYPDGPPVEIRHAMDHTTGLNAAMAAVAALLRQQRTGVGAYVDVAAREVASSLAGDALLAAAAGSPVSRAGNDEMPLAPHNVYPCRGTDQWISIAVGSNQEWCALAQVAGHHEWATDSRFTDPYRRWRHRDELDLLVAAWTQGEEARTLAACLQKAHVPAFPSFTGQDLATDVHLRERGVIIDMEGPRGQRRPVINSPWGFSRTPAGMTRWTPELGEDNDYVFQDLLGLTPESVADLKARQVIY